MLFSRPRPFKEALDSIRARSALPTGMSSAELARIDGEVLERARFSARVRSAEHLDVLDSAVEDFVAGKTDLATARLRIKQFLARAGYRPDAEEAGTLQDFSTRARIDLQLQTCASQAQGYGRWKQQQDAALLDAFPAREFLRVEAREKERPDWPQRWDAARAATLAEGATSSGSGRMVALKNHPIWTALSRFGTPYEPFDFGSGMGTEDVPRSEAMELGLIDRDTQIPPEERPFNEDLKASPKVRSDRLKDLLIQTGAGLFDADGAFVA
jgi:hypothetical protein